MENCYANLFGVFKKQKRKEKPEEKWSEKIIFNNNNNNNNTENTTTNNNKNNKNNTLVVLKEPTGRDIRQRYMLGRELGRDEFGMTYLCKNRQTGEELACKSISKNKLRTAIDIENVRREVEIMRYLPIHPNIVLLKDTFEDEDDVHLIMEFCEGGDLLDRIVSRGDYNEHSAASIIKRIVQVVQMCHKHGVMHRNLKTENILCVDKKETKYLKVTDFRSAMFFQPGERLNEIVGNLYYMAPEVLNRSYGPEIDIWSAGVTLYILLCGFPPFWAETEQGVAKAITQSVIDFNKKPWPKVSHNAKDLVKKMLDPDPKLRLTAQEVLDHPWLIHNLVKMEPDMEKDLVKKMLTAHEVFDHHPWLQNAKTAPNVSLGEKVREKLLIFSAMNRLTKTTSSVIAQHLNDEELWVRDTGIKGQNNYDEVRLRLYRLGQQYPDVDVQRLVDAFDGAKDGYLNYGEFLAISNHLRKRSHEEHVDNAFQFFDKKQSGYIELEELSKTLVDGIHTHSKEVVKAIMHDVDTNMDGKISYEEITNRSFKLMKEWSSELKGKYDKYHIIGKFSFPSL